MSMLPSRCTSELMADVFDIDSGGYHDRKKNSNDYNHRGGWVPVDSGGERRKDPRLARRDDDRKRYSPNASSPHVHHRDHLDYSPSPKSVDQSTWQSPQRMKKSSAQMYVPPQLSLQAPSYQQSIPPPMYAEYNSSYDPSATSYPHGYQQQYPQQQTNLGFTQYSTRTGYQQQPPQNYSSEHQQPGPPGDDYRSGWAPVSEYSSSMGHQPPPPPMPISRPASVQSLVQSHESKTDNLKKEAAIAHELKQQRATLIKQRDEYLRKASVLRRELDKLRLQKHELLCEESPPRDSQRILRENAKLQLEIQNKLKSINNVVDMLSGIIDDGLKASPTADEENKTMNSGDSTPKLMGKKSKCRGRSDDDMINSDNDDNTMNKKSNTGNLLHSERERTGDMKEWPRYNYIHYDPELHWCRVCDVFPRSAKDFLNHLHSLEHRQVTQEHQLVDTPWHKLPTDPELPTYKGASVKRVPIKGLQFFISATAWYCKLCDVWIGDLHCASLHLKSKNHSHNYSNFVEQNPHWETNWLKDREKAYSRCAKSKLAIDDKMDSSGTSSSSSSTASSSEDDSDKAKSIRVAMRNKMRMQAQLILNEEIGGKLEVLGRLVEEERNRTKKEVENVDTILPQPSESVVEDNIINQWMTVNTNNDEHILDNLKGRLKQRQEVNKEKTADGIVERRRDRELKHREIQQRLLEEQECMERDREECERTKERERNRRRKRSDSRSPESKYAITRGRSRSKSNGRNNNSTRTGRGRSAERYYFREDRRNDSGKPRSSELKFKPRRTIDYEDDETQFDKHSSDSYKQSRSKKQSSSSSSHRKLPFIGRMPLFKKRSDGEEKEIKKEDYEIRLSKFEPGNTARAFIPEPGIVHITKLATPIEMPNIGVLINAENPPPPPNIIPEPPQISSTLDTDGIPPPPPIINDTPVSTVAEEQEVQDMDLDEAAPPLPPGVPVAEAKPLAKPAGNHLPRDFQEALNIIFPGDQRPDMVAGAQNDPNLMMQYQYSMGYSMMYPGMQHMYDYSISQDEQQIKEDGVTLAVPADDKASATVSAQPGDDKEDLAMLGIDVEDMAAQTI
ncbi:uncharacterized protein CBL_01739 [Carabus blaptoides fortunei]